MGQLVAKSAKMANEGENLDRIYENIDSLGEVDTVREGAVNEEDSILSEVRQTANEVVELMVESVRVQKEILRALHRNGERLDHIISITGNNLTGKDSNMNKVTSPEIVANPKKSDRVMCHRCRRIGHIRKECPFKYRGNGW